jgi:peptide/nickel transport system substrate-binding protein
MTILSSRSLACRALAAMILPILAVGCGDPEERAFRDLPSFCQEVLPRVAAHLAEVDHPEGERYGGTAVVGGLGELVGGMNSFASADFVARQHQEYLNLMPLVRIDADLEYQPRLARSWELDEEAGRITFHLRDDVRWHDGEPTTARDVEFTFWRAADPRTGFFSMASWEHYETGEEGVEVLDDHTIRFRVSPHAEPLDIWRLLGIMPRHLLEDVPPEELREHPFGTRCPVGNGPFVFQEHRIGESWTFARNPDFPDELGGPPYLDRYVYRIVPEQSTLLTELLTGTVDVVIAPSPEMAARIEAEGGVRLLSFPFREYVAVVWNGRRPQLQDARVRRALTMGLNRQEMLEAVLHGRGEIANAGVPPFHWAHHTGLRNALRYDPEEARRLLEEAGWTDPEGSGVRRNAEGVPLEVEVSYNMGNRLREEIAGIMQEQLRGIGVAAQPRAVEWGAFTAGMVTPDVRAFDGAVLSIVTSFHVSDRDQFHSSSADAPMGLAGMRDPELDRLLDALPRVVDREEAIPLWHQYQERIVALQPYTYVVFPDRLGGVGPRLQGVEMDVTGDLATVDRWWVPVEERRRP